MAAPPKKNKGMYGEDDDSEPGMYFNQPFGFRQSDKEMLGQQIPLPSPSPSQQMMYGGSFYSQQTGAGLGMPPRSMGGVHFGRTSTPTNLPPNFNIPLPPQAMGGVPSSQQSISLSTRGVLSINPQQQAQMARLSQNQSSQATAMTAQIKRNLAASGLFTSSNPMAGINFFSRSAQVSQAGLDPSEFPTLGARTTPPGPTAPARSYVGMVSKPSQEQAPEFQIQPEDFPALSGSQNPLPSAVDGAQKMGSSMAYDQLDGKLSTRFTGDLGETGGRRPGILTHSDGTVSNIPGDMMADQFGIIGLLSFMRGAAASEEAGDLQVTMTPGFDLISLGLNMNSNEMLYNTFQSPYADAPCRPQDIDFHVPSEYLTNTLIADKLAPIKLNKYGEDLLFYIFYNNPGDLLQIAAAAELYNREWRFHKEDKVWLTRCGDITVKTQSFERGTYMTFDPNIWKKVPREMAVEYEKLEDRPQVPSSLTTPAAYKSPSMIHLQIM